MPDSSQYWDGFHSSQIPTASQTEVHHQLDKPPSPDLWAGFPEADLPPGSLIAGHVDHPIVVHSSPQVVPPQGATPVTQPLEQVDSVAVQSSPLVALSVAQSPPQETYLKPVHLHPSGSLYSPGASGSSASATSYEHETAKDVDEEDVVGEDEEDAIDTDLVFTSSSVGDQQMADAAQTVNDTEDDGGDPVRRFILDVRHRIRMCDILIALWIGSGTDEDTIGPLKNNTVMAFVGERANLHVIENQLYREMRDLAGARAALIAHFRELRFLFTHEWPEELGGRRILQETIIEIAERAMEQTKIPDFQRLPAFIECERIIGGDMETAQEVVALNDELKGMVKGLQNILLEIMMALRGISIEKGVSWVEALTP